MSQYELTNHFILRVDDDSHIIEEPQRGRPEHMEVARLAAARVVDADAVDRLRTTLAAYTENLNKEFSEY